ncbi:hypothetical protein NVV30_24795 [Pseudomonas syringae]|uniref:hypothetical protein n=1 Tax=Pseudomonas syringae TaxID=317 RepID=UPI00215AA2DE|nr:hypothetical protein [Pseudomonas syringae]MCR8721897.1 hypothetical protein [Pseudomonas syringae]
MKWIVFIIAVISTVWQLSFVNDHWWQDVVLAVLSISWIVATIYFYDFIMAVSGKSTPYMERFYSEVKRDVLFTLIAAIALFIIVSCSPVVYSLSNIDIAFFGFPFLLGSIWDVQSLSKLSIARAKFSRPLVWCLLVALMVVGSTYFYFLILIYSNSFSTSKSLWLQITLLLTTFCLYIAAHQIVFIMKKQKMEVSPVLLALFSSIKHSPGIYQQAVVAAELWNAAVFRQKQELRRKLKRKKKKR